MEHDDGVAAQEPKKSPEVEPKKLSEDDLVSYEQYIAACAEAALKDDGKPSEIIYNKSPIHAAILIRQLIWAARRDLRILSGSLNVDVYGGQKTVDVARDFFARRQGHAKVLLDWQPGGSARPLEQVVAENPLLCTMRAASAGTERFQLRYVPPRVAQLYPFHFLVADEASFRFEEDRSKFDAVAQFGNPLLARKLAARFDEIWNLSKAPLTN